MRSNGVKSSPEAKSVATVMWRRPRLAGSRWESLLCREGGLKKAVAVVSHLGPNHVEVEDADTHRRRVMLTASLLTAYSRMADDEGL